MLSDKVEPKRSVTIGGSEMEINFHTFYSSVLGFSACP